MKTLSILMFASILAACSVACSAAVEGPAGSSAVPLLEADGEAPTPSGANAQQCPASFHPCSLGVTGYDCLDDSWYFCKADDAGACPTPATCVPEPPADAGEDAFLAWFYGR